MITLNELNSSRQTNYIILFILVLIFTGSILSIKYIYCDTSKKDEEDKEDKTNDENKDSTLKQLGKIFNTSVCDGCFFCSLLYYF